MGFFSWIKSVILGTNEVVPTKKYKGNDWNKPITYSYPSVSKKRVVERSVGSTRSGIPAGPVNHIASRPENSSPTYCASNDLLNPLNPLSPISPFSVWHHGSHQGGNDSDRHKPDNCGYHKIDDSYSGGHHGGHHGHSHNHTDNAGSSNHSHHSHQSDYGSSHSSDHHTSYDSGSSSYDSGSSDSGGSSDCGGGSSD